jgi:hypothetical protein
MIDRNLITAKKVICLETLDNSLQKGKEYIVQAEDGNHIKIMENWYPSCFFEKITEGEKCFVKPCRNKTYQGDFKGNVCIPCYALAKDIEQEKIHQKYYYFQPGVITFIIDNWREVIKQAENKTEKIHTWMKNLTDDQKQRFAINWKIPHSLFSVACNIYPGGYEELQDIDWYKIFNSRDMGVWSHGGKVIVL